MHWPVFYLPAVRRTAAGTQIPVTPIVLPTKVQYMQSCSYTQTQCHKDTWKQ